MSGWWKRRRETGVQIVYSSRRGSRDIEHIGSAHEDAELVTVARQRLAAGQGELEPVHHHRGRPPAPTSAQPSTKSTADQLHAKLSQVRDSRGTSLFRSLRAPETPPARWRGRRRNAPHGHRLGPYRLYLWLGSPAVWALT